MLFVVQGSGWVRVEDAPRGGRLKVMTSCGSVGTR